MKRAKYSVNASGEGTCKEARLDDESRVLAQIMVHPSQPHKSAPPPIKTEPYFLHLGGSVYTSLVTLSNINQYRLIWKLFPDKIVLHQRPSPQFASL